MSKIRYAIKAHDGHSNAMIQSGWLRKRKLVQVTDDRQLFKTERDAYEAMAAAKILYSRTPIEERLTGVVVEVEKAKK